MEHINDVITVCLVPHDALSALPAGAIPPQTGVTSLYSMEHFNVLSVFDWVQTLPCFSVVEPPHFACHRDSCVSFPLLMEEKPSWETDEELSSYGRSYTHTLSLTIKDMAEKWRMVRKDLPYPEENTSVLLCTADGKWFFLYSLPDTFSIKETWKDWDEASLSLKITCETASPFVAVF